MCLHGVQHTCIHPRQHRSDLRRLAGQDHKTLPSFRPGRLWLSACKPDSDSKRSQIEVELTNLLCAALTRHWHPEAETWWWWHFCKRGQVAEISATRRSELSSGVPSDIANTRTTYSNCCSSSSLLPIESNPIAYIESNLLSSSKMVWKQRMLLRTLSDSLSMWTFSAFFFCGLCSRLPRRFGLHNRGCFLLLLRLSLLPFVRHL